MSGLGEWDQAPAADTPARDEEVAPNSDDQRRAHAPDRLHFGSVEQFVCELLAPTYRRSLSGHASAWCPEWWRHAEAIARLEALWRSWEFLRRDPATGMSVWYRDHADHHMAVLLSADGPFKGCGREKGHRPMTSLPLVAAPEGLFQRA